MGFAEFDAYVRDRVPEYIDELKALIRQPTVSAQGIGVADTARIVLERTRRAGVDATALSVDGGPPTIVGETGQGPRTVLVYNPLRRAASRSARRVGDATLRSDRARRLPLRARRLRQQGQPHGSAAGDRGVPRDDGGPAAARSRPLRGRRGKRLGPPRGVRRAVRRPAQGRRLHLGGGVQGRRRPTHDLVRA